MPFLSAGVLPRQPHSMPCSPTQRNGIVDWRDSEESVQTEPRRLNCDTRRRNMSQPITPLHVNVDMVHEADDIEPRSISQRSFSVGQLAPPPKLGDFKLPRVANNFTSEEESKLPLSGLQQRLREHQRASVDL